jgi:hypothetical protein
MRVVIPAEALAPQTQAFLGSGSIWILHDKFSAVLVSGEEFRGA